MIVDKPWGRVATHVLNQPSSVRLVTVEPGHHTTPHYHRLRDEAWVVLDDGVTIAIGDDVVAASAGEEFMVPAEATHTITCTGTERGRVLVIAYGYTSDDDVLTPEGAPPVADPDW